MEVGRLQIDVVLVSAGMVLMVISVVVVIREQQRTDEIYNQPDCRNPYRLVVMDDERLKKAFNRFHHHENGNPGQDNGAGVRSQNTDLAAAETVKTISRVLARHRVSTGSDEECGDMSAHVAAVRKKCHRMKPQTGDDLNRHHDEGEQDHPSRISFRRSEVPDKIVTVPPRRWI